MTVGAWPVHDGAGHRPADPAALRVAAVLDERSAAGLAPECGLLEVASERWRATLEERAPDLLLVESAWAGSGGSWQYQVASYNHPDSRGLPALRELVAWCRRRDVPTVFWSHSRAHEVPRFAEAASLFDHVFTSRPEALDAEPLPVAVQPRIHGPLSPREPPSEDACYLGPYRPDRPADELEALELLLDAALDVGLVIHDPSAVAAEGSSEFPERFRGRIRDRVPYRSTGAAYKAHRVALVAGGGPASRAVPRGALESAACGSAFVSGPHAGLAEAFGELATIVHDPRGAAAAISLIAERGEPRPGIATAAQRLALTEHSYRRRLAAIAAAAGHPVSAEAGLEVAALVLVDDLEDLGRLARVAEVVAEQSRAPAEVLVGVARDDALDAELDRLAGGGRISVRALRQERETPGEDRYRELAAVASSPWVAPLHVSATYGRHHLTDLLVRAESIPAEVFGTAIHPDGRIAQEVDRYARAVHPHSALVRREAVADAGWPDGVDAALRDGRAPLDLGLRCYAVGGRSFAPGPAGGAARAPELLHGEA